MSNVPEYQKAHKLVFYILSLLFSFPSSVCQLTLNDFMVFLVYQECTPCCVVCGFHGDFVCSWTHTPDRLTWWNDGNQALAGGYAKLKVLKMYFCCWNRDWYYMYLHINCSLVDVMEKDVNAESRKMAIQSLMLLENVIKQVSFPLQ